MKPIFLFLMLTCCLLAVGCASSTPIDVRLGEQNLTNVNQDAADDETMIDLLTRAKAAKEGDKWQDEWTPGVAESIRKQNEGSKAVAEELLKNAKANNSK